MESITSEGQIRLPLGILSRQYITVVRSRLEQAKRFANYNGKDAVTVV